MPLPPAANFRLRILSHDAPMQPAQFYVMVASNRTGGHIVPYPAVIEVFDPMTGGWHPLQQVLEP